MGTCGFSRSRDEVFGKVQAVEVQDTFYRRVEPATARKWRESAPRDFVFTVKASQLITHDPTSPTYRRSDVRPEGVAADNYGFFKPTREVMAAWRRTEEICRVIGAKAVIFQTPPSFVQSKDNIENMVRFFARTETSMLRAWEPRGTWDSDEVKDICERHRLIHCVDPFAREPVTRGPAYLRLHGKPPGGRMYYYSYSDADLSRLAATCEGFEEPYVLFNNISMLADAVRFMRLLNVQE